MEEFRARSLAIANNDDEEEKRPKAVPINRSGQLEMTRDGMRLPEKNAFEFTVRPHSVVMKSDRRGSDSKGKLSGRQQI